MARRRAQRLSALGGGLLLGACLGFGSAGLGSIGSAWALSASDARAQANQALVDVQSQSGQVRTNVGTATPPNPNAWIAAAELHMNTGQWQEAIDLLNRVVELGRQGKASPAAVADATFMLGQAYMNTNELYSARREFEQVTDHASEPVYQQSAPLAASRLVDIALATDRKDSLDDVLARIDRLSQSGSSQPLKYARAKALLAMGRYDEAAAASQGIDSPPSYALRAYYLRGVVAMKQATPAADPTKKPDFSAAIAQFQKAYDQAKGTPDTDSRTIADLALLATARLYFEQGDNSRAVQVYEKLPRTSPYFARALFELAWAYVRLGDYARGQGALEVLRVLDPGLIDGADAALLLADLQLRSGRYAVAEAAYRAVRDKYDPLRQQVDDYLLSHPDAATNYDALTGVEVGGAAQVLPPLVFAWAREEATEGRIFAIVDDVARARALLKNGRRRVVLLMAALQGDTRSEVFPDARSQLELVTGLLNQLAVARLALARGMDDEAGKGTPELEAVRKERRALMTRQGQVPTRPGDFSVREAASEKQWDKVSEELQRSELEVDHLNALINGLKRTLADAEVQSGVIDPDAVARYRAEIQTHELELQAYRKQIDGYRQSIEMGRVQTGFGDARYAEDERVRLAFRDAFEREDALAGAGGDADARDYAGSIKPLLAQLRSAEAGLEGSRAKLEAILASQSEDTLSVVRQESATLESYGAQLDALDETSRTLVGEVARDNLTRVRQRLKDVVLRADVGSIQKSWEVRENQRYRVRDLQRERAQEETLINDELREVLDDQENDK